MLMVYTCLFVVEVKPLTFLGMSPDENQFYLVSLQLACVCVFSSCLVLNLLLKTFSFIQQLLSCLEHAH